MTQEKKETTKVPEKFQKLVEQLESLSVLEAAELGQLLEEKWGVKAAAQVVAAPAAGAAPTVAAAEAASKTVFTVVLSAVGEKKIDVIKTVRDATGKSLKEAKDLTDAAGSSPQVLKENAKKEEAEELKKKLEAVGAKVELK